MSFISDFEGVVESEGLIADESDAKPESLNHRKWCFASGESHISGVGQRHALNHAQARSAKNINITQGFHCLLKNH